MNKTILSAVIGAVAIVAGIYLYLPFAGKFESVKSGPVAEAPLTMANYVKRDAPQELAPFTFVDGAGASHDVSALKGKVTVLNLWATWCAPCRKEMPELAQLQKDLGSDQFQVVALSEDLKGYDASAAFLKQVGADNLTLYADDKATALDAVKAPGLPVTLVLNKDGKEVGRLLGPASWDSDEAKTLIKGVVEGH